MNPTQISVAALAYLGDCVIELCVRSRLVEAGLSTSAHLNAAALSYVRAGAQAEAMKRLHPHLTEEEERYFHRGRNAGHTKNVPKSATVSEYRSATGMEVLFGFLHASGQTERIGELFMLAYPEIDEEIKNILKGKE